MKLGIYVCFTLASIAKFCKVTDEASVVETSKYGPYSFPGIRFLLLKDLFKVLILLKAVLVGVAGVAHLITDYE